MDRYFSNLTHAYECEQEPASSLELSELHITGVVSMYLASKYEDVFPLLMKTIVKKIGHDKITPEHVRAREGHIFKALGFKLGAATVLEFLDAYMLRVFEDHHERDFIYRMSVYLAKMCLHHEKLCCRHPS